MGEGGEDGVSEDRESSDLCVAEGERKRGSSCVGGSRRRRAMKTNGHGGPQRSVHRLQMVHGHDEMLR